MKWAEFKFPPINLWSTPKQLEIASFKDDKDNNIYTYIKQVSNTEETRKSIDSIYYTRSR
jgi:hypothetical protein